MPTSQAQKDAIKRYKEKNREKINEQARKDYQKLKSDPERLAKRNEGIRRNRIEILDVMQIYAN
jgi:hypothetical protein